MTNEELIQYGINWDKALESRGDEPMSESRQFLASAIQSLESQRWIPVTEKNPEETGEYMTTIKWIHCDHTFTYHIVKRKYYAETQEWDDRLVIAWMPLLQPYKAESEDEE